MEINPDIPKSLRFSAVFQFLMVLYQSEVSLLPFWSIEIYKDISICSYVQFVSIYDKIKVLSDS